MFHWTETDVGNLIASVIDSVRSFNHADSVATQDQILTALSTELKAVQWHRYQGCDDASQGRSDDSWRAGMIRDDELPSDACDSGKNLNGDKRVREGISTEVLSGEDLEAAHRSSCTRLRKWAREHQCQCDEIVVRRCLLRGGVEYSAIACTVARPDGSCQCTEFYRPLEHGEFTARDESLLRALASQLLCPQRSHTSEPVPPEASLPSERAPLPRRQREVLECLLSGCSVKEIAGTLGISPYTVNDYIKALYRRYEVCSRGELLAAVHGIRKGALPPVARRPARSQVAG